MLNKELYLEYAKYLEGLSNVRYDYKKYGSENYNLYISDDNFETIEIIRDKKQVGFFIIQTHIKLLDNFLIPQYYIAQAYIKPEYRRKGIMSKEIKDYINDHLGVYVYIVLNKNEIAHKFWNKLFFNTVDLTELFSQPKDCNVEGFKQYVVNIQEKI